LEGDSAAQLVVHLDHYYFVGEGCLPELVDAEVIRVKLIAGHVELLHVVAHVDGLLAADLRVQGACEVPLDV
jgi:hypothetical protein